MQPYSSLITGGASLSCTTSYQAIGTVQFNLAAGATYRFRSWFTYSVSTIGTASAMEAIPGAANGLTASFIVCNVWIQTSNTGGTGSQVHSLLDSTTQGSPGNAAQATTAYGLVFDGLIDVGAAGTLQFKAKQTASSGVTMTVASGGVGYLQQLSA